MKVYKVAPNNLEDIGNLPLKYYQVIILSDHDSAIAAKDARIRELEKIVNGASIRMKQHAEDAMKYNDKANALERDKAELVEAIKTAEQFLKKYPFPAQSESQRVDRSIALLVVSKLSQALRTHAASKVEG